MAAVKMIKELVCSLLIHLMQRVLLSPRDSKATSGGYEKLLRPGQEIVWHITLHKTIKCHFNLLFTYIKC